MFERKNYLTVKEAAEQLGYFAPYINKLIRADKIRAIRRGRQYFITQGELDRYVGIPEPTQIDQLI